MNALITLALGLAGKKFSESVTDKEMKVVEPPEKKMKSWNNPNGADIYNSYLTDEIRREVRDASIGRQIRSLQPGRTGIIPEQYNALEKEENGDIVIRDEQQNKIQYDENIDSVMKKQRKLDMLMAKNIEGKEAFNPTQFLEKERELTDPTNHEKLIYDRSKNESSYVEQFRELEFDNPDTFVPNRAIPKNTNGLRRLDMERNLALAENWSLHDKNKNMTYNVTKAGNFIHENMVPHYSGKYGYGDYEKGLNNYKDQKLELFTGSTNSARATHFPKHEIEPFFAPQMNSNNLHGVPTMTQYFEDRVWVNPQRNGELLFEPIRVNTGLNLDYFEHGEEGYQPIFRPLDKDVDQLRVATKPRISYHAVINHGQKGNKRPVQAEVNKNRPFSYWEVDPEDMLRTFGYVTAPTVRGYYHMPETRKDGTLVPYVGQPGSAQTGDIGMTKPEYIFPKVKISDKIVYGTQGPRNIGTASGRNRQNVQVYDNERNHTFPDRAGFFRSADYGFVIDPKDVPDPTKRQITSVDTQQSAVLTGHQAPIAPPSDTAKPTLIETMINNTYSNMLTGFAQGRTYNPSDVPAPTIRDVTQDVDRSGAAIVAQLLGMPHIVGDKMRTTIKETTLTDQNTQQIGNNIGRGYAYDPNDVTKTTMKQLTINTKQAGNIYQNRDGGYQSNVHFAPTTIRQTTENQTQAGNVYQNKDGGYQSNVHFAPTTLKQMIENADRGGSLYMNKQGGYEADQVYAPTTLKQMIENAERAGHIGASAVNRTGYMSTNYFAPPTARQATSNTYYRGPAHIVQTDSQPVYDPYYMMEISDRKEILAQTGRAPVTSNYEKTPGTEMTSYRIKKLKNTVRDPMPSIINNPLQQVRPGCTTKNGISTPQESVRLDTCLFSALQQNPYYIPITDYYQPPGYPNYNLPMQPTYQYAGYNNLPSKNDVPIIQPQHVPLTYGSQA
jgi:hypothetical protein